VRREAEGGREGGREGGESKETKKSKGGEVRESKTGDVETK